MKTPDHSICPDCGRNSEFILHEDGCPQFGKEVEEFLKAHDAEVASWPEAARASLARLERMQSQLFGKTLRQHQEIERLNALLKRHRIIP